MSAPAGPIAIDPAVRWRLTEELFHRAMECPPETRTQTLTDWCGPDTEMLTAVLALVEADSRVEDLISSAPPANQGEFLERNDLPQPEVQTAEDHDPLLGRVLGAFRLERQLGRGGMGVVYLGERIQGGFAQQVAVKLLGHHMHSVPAVAQFLEERQTLATLDHPNIARLLDGGVTSDGFPYVVMEYVEGRRLDQACDDPATSIEQVICWMLQLCNAVTYVHRNLILHRDLKPGNVMVTSEGKVKLLDFGTLKRFGPEGQIDSAMTQVGMRPVTLRYASPEHIEGTAVSTATDVYSLGMVLYRLIAGHLPEELDNLSIGQLLQRLQAGGFAPPSQAALNTARTDTIDTPRFQDLDAIVAKALRYEPEARYPTVAALATDLINVLENKPVSARDGSLQYRAAKFYRRNSRTLYAAAAVLLVLVGGLSAMAWQGHLAHLQELRAEKGVEDERELAHMMLFDYFEKLEVIPGSVEAQRKAATQALTYLDNLTRIAPGSNLELDSIRGYTVMGSLLGNPYSANLGNVPEAKQTLEKGLMLAQARSLKHPTDLKTMQALAQVEMAMGDLYLGNGDAFHGEAYLRAAADVSAQIARDPKVTGEMLEQCATVTDSLGDAYDPGRGYATSDLNKAIQTYLLSDKYDAMCESVDPHNALCRYGLPVGQYKLGMLVEDTDPASAAAHYNQGLASAAAFPPNEIAVARTLRLKNYLGSRLSIMLIRTGHIEEGLTLAKQVHDSLLATVRQDELNNRTRFDLVAFATDLAVACHDYARDREAEQSSQEALDMLKTLLERSPNNRRWQMIEAQNRMTYGKVEIALGHQKLGARMQQQGTEQAVHLAGNKDASPEILGDAAEDLLALHLDPQDAQKALEFAQRAVNAFAKPTPSQLLTLSKSQLAVGRSKDASKTAEMALIALVGPIKSKIIADEVEQAHKLARH